MEHTNGEAHKDGSRPSLAEVFRPVATAPAQAPARSLDPGGIARLVEHEVAALLGAAEAESDRIRSKALAGVKMAEAKVAALQQQVQSTLAQLVELAGRIEQEPPARVEPTATAEARVEPTATAEARVEPATPSVFDTPEGREPVAPSIPPSDEVVRLLRENLT